MGPREIAQSRWGVRLSTAFAELNARHPWSHNEHFHSWILSRLPPRRATALDVGCGQGNLLLGLAEHVDHVRGIDADPTMSRLAAHRCADLPNVQVDNCVFTDVTGTFDIVTMVAVLHHLDVEQALEHVRKILAPGGRFLCVGLARSVSPVDHVWDAVSAVTNPIIGFVKHPWPASQGPRREPFPMRDPTLSFDEIRTIAERVMPGVGMRHNVGFRHTIDWTHP